MKNYVTSLKIVKFLEIPGLLINIVRGTAENEVNEQKAGFLGMYVSCYITC